MKILVIGASAAGMKAACRARRLLPKAEITVIEEGEYISWAGCGLPYYLSGDINSFRDLITTPYEVEKSPQFFEEAKGIKVLTGTKALRLDPQAQVVIAIAPSGEKTFAYDALVIATGASPVKPPIEGLDLPGVTAFTRPEEAIALRRDCEQGKVGRVAIIGAGFAGCELCEAFKALWGIGVELFELAQQVLPGMLDPEIARLVEIELQQQGIGLNLGAKISAVQADGSKLRVVTDSQTCADFDRIVVATGVRPNADLAAAAGAKIGSSGGVLVDPHMRTDLPNVWAAGDCVQLTSAKGREERYLPLGSLANRMGRIAASNIAGKKDALDSLTGASCLKVFDLNVAAVGQTAGQAEDKGITVGRSWGTFPDHAFYYPESKTLAAAMIHDRQSGKLLGVQAAGRGDVVGMINAASLMIQQKFTLSQINQYEPAYAPPYANPLDPLHYLAWTAGAHEEENVVSFSPLELEQKIAKALVLDVREEFEIGEAPFPATCENLLSVPYSQLRSRIAEIPQGKRVVVVCQRGTRSSEAARFLTQNGFTEVSYLGGGLGFFKV